MDPAKTVLLFLLACALAPIGARASECLPINVRNPEGNYIVPGVMGDIVYRSVNGKELALDAYVQKHGRKRPAVIVVHGGGWESGSRVAFVGQFLEMLTRAGYNWFSVDYRLGGIRNYKDALDDLRAATDFIRCNAKRFRIDPDNFALFGEDAGAHLGCSGSRTSTRERARRCDATPPCIMRGRTWSRFYSSVGRRTASSLNTALSQTNLTRPAPTSTPLRSKARRTGWRIGKAVPNGWITKRNWSSGLNRNSPHENN
jgi:BD-FAE